jgi:hypothetical protein
MVFRCSCVGRCGRESKQNPDSIVRIDSKHRDNRGQPFCTTTRPSSPEYSSSSEIVIDIPHLFTPHSVNDNNNENQITKWSVCTNLYLLRPEPPTEYKQQYSPETLESSNPANYSFSIPRFKNKISLMLKTFLSYPDPNTCFITSRSSA